MLDFEIRRDVLRTWDSLTLHSMFPLASQVSISYLEIYNDSLYDLLDITTAPHEINVFEDRTSRVNIVGLRTANVASEREALALLFEVRPARAFRDFNEAHAMSQALSDEIEG